MYKWQAKPSPDSSPMGFNRWHWGIDFTSILDEAVGNAVSSTLAEALTENPPDVYFRYQYSASGDPLRITIMLPFGEDEDSNPSWESSLSDLVDDMLETHREWDGKVSKDSEEKFLIPIAKGLRELADRIDSSFRA